MKETNLQTRLEMYLSLRESLGGVPAMHRSALESFVRYLSEHCDASNVRAQTAIDWARGPDRQRGACTQYVRLSLARGFLTYLKASCPETEIPGRNLIGSWRRPNPYIVAWWERSCSYRKTFILETGESRRCTRFERRQETTVNKLPVIAWMHDPNTAESVRRRYLAS